jgi:hypothetical protein
VVSTLLHPVGPRPPAVYWRRRVVLLALLAAVVLAVVWLLPDGGDAGGAAAATEPDPGLRAVSAPEPTSSSTGSPADSPTSGATESATASPTTSGPTEAAACAPPALTVGTAADAADYPAGATPKFTVTITNTGTAPCSLDVGSPAAVGLLVVSGSDRIWSSDDCQPPAEPRTVTLAPGAQEVQSVTWDRTRSAEGCPGGLPEPQPGTYQVTAHAGQASSPAVPLTLG